MCTGRVYAQFNGNNHSGLEPDIVWGCFFKTDLRVVMIKTRRIVI